MAEWEQLGERKKKGEEREKKEKLDTHRPSWKALGPTGSGRSERRRALGHIILAIKGALEDAGIQAMVQADTAGGMREHLAWSGAGFKILVREEDAIAAREMLTSPIARDESPDADFQTDHDPRPLWRRFT